MTNKKKILMQVLLGLIPIVTTFSGFVMDETFAKDPSAGLVRYGMIMARVYETGFPLWLFGAIVGLCCMVVIYYLFLRRLDKHRNL
jgi:hypothetical protein